MKGENADIGYRILSVDLGHSTGGASPFLSSDGPFTTSITGRVLPFEAPNTFEAPDPVILIAHPHPFFNFLMTIFKWIWPQDPKY